MKKISSVVATMLTASIFGIGGVFFAQNAQAWVGTAGGSGGSKVPVSSSGGVGATVYDTGTSWMKFEYIGGNLLNLYQTTMTTADITLENWAISMDHAPKMVMVFGILVGINMLLPTRISLTLTMRGRYFILIGMDTGTLTCTLHIKVLMGHGVT